MITLHHTQKSFFASRGLTPVITGKSISVTVGDATVSDPSPKGLIAKLSAMNGAVPHPKKGAGKKRKASPPVKGNVIKSEYRSAYRAENGCGDAIQEVLAHAFIVDDVFNRKAFIAFARENGVWQSSYDGLNNGMVRMNVGNRIRAMVRKGQPVTLNGKKLEA